MKLITKCIIISVIPYVLLFSLKTFKNQININQLLQHNQQTEEETKSIAATLPSTISNTLPIQKPINDSEKIFVVIKSDKIEIAALVLIDDINQQIEVTNVLSPNIYLNCIVTKNCTYTNQTTSTKENIKYYVIIDNNYLLETVKLYEPIKLNYCVKYTCTEEKEYYTQEEIQTLLQTISSQDLYPSIISGVKNKILDNVFSLKTLSIINNLNNNLDHNLPMSLFNKSIELVLKKKDYKIIIN